MKLGPSRLLTLEAMTLLPVARFLVGRVEMRLWRQSLGAIDGAGAATTPSHSADIESWRRAARIARHVERAAGRLPFGTKCLPRAMVLQWMLRRRDIAARLVIARAKSDPNAALHDEGDEWHAWVERDGEMLIGHCNRDQYHPLLTLSSFPACRAKAAG